MLPNWSAVNGDSSDIFSTAVLPSARHGAVFQVAVMNGTFQGDTSAHTPTGWRMASMRWSLRVCGSTSP
ncbi:hypothetical protein G6F64_014136 [Rhizopus arrhizus]|uniref:Uncharacterized protein n=1 Tax=Rhizopus oryzae TaxID=64495 RepID=A0A9P6WTY2_RHIOR|nr:hypothetical protein G6F64_014136 [Rhizopus arrhizus]